MVYGLLLVGVFVLAWSNGANDNFKGVATLYGSGATEFRPALVWATGATLLGSLVSVLIAHSLAISFSGKGLIPDQVLAPPLLAAIGLAAAVTILLATFLGMPTSTTHALTGALVGSGLAATGPLSIDWHRLLSKFAQPLLLSPVLAFTLTWLLYALLRRLRRRLGIDGRSCLCVTETATPAVELAAGGAAYLVADETPRVGVEVGKVQVCAGHGQGRLLDFRIQPLVNALHFASSGAVCFARAVNDTPKIAALLFATTALSTARLSAVKLAVVALVMAVGGWLQSRKVAHTMSKEITELNAGQGLTANLVTAALVLGASRLGLPVSTTHVSCGSIFGIGMANQRGRWRTIVRILTTWVTTLPLAFLLGLGFARLLGAGS